MNILISNKYRPKRREDLQHMDLEDGCVLYDREKAAMYTLNTTASFFWFYCDGNLKVEQIADEVSLTTGVMKEEVLKDVIETVTFFQENGLLTSESS